MAYVKYLCKILIFKFSQIRKIFFYIYFHKLNNLMNYNI